MKRIEFLKIFFVAPFTFLTANNHIETGKIVTSSKRSRIAFNKLAIAFQSAAGSASQCGLSFGDLEKMQAVLEES